MADVLSKCLLGGCVICSCNYYGKKFQIVGVPQHTIGCDVNTDDNNTRNYVVKTNDVVSDNNLEAVDNGNKAINKVVNDDNKNIQLVNQKKLSNYSNLDGDVINNSLNSKVNKTQNVDNVVLDTNKTCEQNSTKKSNSNLVNNSSSSILHKKTVEKKNTTFQNVFSVFNSKEANASIKNQLKNRDTKQSDINSHMNRANNVLNNTQTSAIPKGNESMLDRLEIKLTGHTILFSRVDDSVKKFVGSMKISVINENDGKALDGVLTNWSGSEMNGSTVLLMKSSFLKDMKFSIKAQKQKLNVRIKFEYNGIVKFAMMNGSEIINTSNI